MVISEVNLNSQPHKFGLNSQIATALVIRGMAIVFSLFITWTDLSASTQCPVSNICLALSRSCSYVHSSDFPTDFQFDSSIWYTIRLRLFDSSASFRFEILVFADPTDQLVNRVSIWTPSICWTVNPECFSSCCIIMLDLNLCYVSIKIEYWL